MVIGGFLLVWYPAPHGLKWVIKTNLEEKLLKAKRRNTKSTLSESDPAENQSEIINPKS